MTLTHIADRNRANAAKSTGPKTRAGKAASAQNARRHGATGMPDASCVSLWLAVIIGRPEISHKDLMPSGESGQLALNLAIAEARLSAAEGALAASAGEDKQEGDDVHGLFKTALDAAFDTAIHISERKLIMDDITQLARLRLSQAKEHVRRQRLLARYAREARSARSRAIAAWSAHISQGRNNPLRADQHDLPK